MTPKLKTLRFMDQLMEDLATCACQMCGTVYQIRFVKPDENYNDFGIWFCPYCGDLTESIPGWVIKHSYAWPGKIPCTGVRRCIFCGKPE